MPQTELPPLPIDAVLQDIAGALAAGSSAVLVAPPGAGKTTRVPLHLLQSPWLDDGRIIMLEPRRLAARGAAEHMARLLGEKLGEQVGLRTRLQTAIGPRTRIEVVTEGVFTRMILDDPGLEGIGAVLFDEFHERSLDADQGLALALDAQSGLRENLRLLVMSATLDHARVGELLGNAPLIKCDGRAYPVETRYLGRNADQRVEDRMTAAIMSALDAETGSILAFLPGQAEIRRVAERLAQRIDARSVDVAPLYGGLDLHAQDRAIAPSPSGRRKVVLATSIAETSLTIEGVRVVIDCGLSRVPRYEPGSGLTRLETIRAPRSAVDQRRGRAGRLEPGVCYRLWSEPETQSLPAFAEPEIRNADLTGLLLDCASWGVTDPTTLAWLDPPPAAALEVARSELLALGALDADGRLTALGGSMAKLPLPSRLAAMVLRAAASGNTREAAEIAAVLVERGLGGNDTELVVRVSAFRADRSRRAEDMRRLAAHWATAASNTIKGRVERSPATVAELLALAFPDRIAKSRGTGGQYLLASGRGARLEDNDPLSRSAYLVVAEIVGSAAAGRIRLATALDETELKTIAADRIEETSELTFDVQSASVKSRIVRRIGAIVLASEPRKVELSEQTAQVLCAGIARIGVDRLAWSDHQRSVRERVAFLRARGDESWPDLTDAMLMAQLDAWLLPFLAGKTALSQISSEDVGHAFDTLLPGALRGRLDSEAPSHVQAPTGNRHRIDYTGPLAPSVAVRVQELFGLSVHPSIAGGRLPLTLELLSPAHRPIQITRDLPGFWNGSWTGVRAEMRGRYPRHEWPQDPANAKPTARAKPRGQ